MDTSARDAGPVRGAATVVGCASMMALIASGEPDDPKAH